jgi:predicted nucleic acid-binding protein
MYLRDSLLGLAAADLYRPLWSPRILTELQTVLVREQVMSQEHAERIVTLMRTHFPESEAVGYEPLIDSLACHQGDRHVLAAAITSGATLLVTDNLKDFPRAATEPHDIEVLTPDQFLLELLDGAPATVIRVLRTQAEGYKRDPRTLNGLLASLNRSGLREFSNEVRRQLA